MYHWLGAGLQHNRWSGGIKAVFVHFQVRENKDGRERAPQVYKLYSKYQILSIEFSNSCYVFRQ